MIVEKANAGQMDHVKHALDLFVDFAAIFVRLLVRWPFSHVLCPGMRIWGRTQGPSVHSSGGSQCRDAEAELPRLRVHSVRPSKCATGVEFRYVCLPAV